MEEQRYTSTHHLGHTGPVTGSLYFTLYLLLKSILFTTFLSLLSLVEVVLTSVTETRRQWLPKTACHYEAGDRQRCIVGIAASKFSENYKLFLRKNNSFGQAYF